MSAFHAGQVVVCIDPGPRPLTEGRRYTVFSVTELRSGEYLDVRNDDGDLVSYYADRFRPASDAVNEHADALLKAFSGGA